MTTIATSSVVRHRAATGEGGPRSDSRPIAGLPLLLRFAARRDRLRGLIWVAASLAIVLSSAVSVVALYETDEELREYGELAGADVAFKAFAGPGFGLDDPTQGSIVMNEVLVFTLVGVALMSIFLVTRHTRAEEDTGRAELVRAAPVGRHAQLVATCMWVGALVLLVGGGLTAGMWALGLPAAGSIAFGATAAGTGLVFVGVTAVSAQTSSSGRAANSTAGLVLGGSFLLRAVGDIGNGWMTWLSPLGWAQNIQAYADERWWVLVLLVVTTAVLVAVAVALSARRDLGAGILAPRPGPATGDPRLGSPLALAARLQRTALMGWAAGLGVLALFMGIIGDQAEAFLENEEVAAMFAMTAEASVTDSFLATAVSMIALVASGFTVAAVLRLRTEERATRAEAILATPVSRARWLAGHLVVAVAGSAVIMVVAGLAIGVGFFTQSGNADRMLPVLGAALVLVAPLAVMAGIAVALVGVAPRRTVVAWATVALVAVVGFLGETLDLPGWFRAASPFHHTPLLPAESMAWLPLALLVAVFAALVTLAMVGARRRDIG